VVAIFIEAFLRGQRPTVFGDGTQVRDFVYVGDVADANLRVLGQSLAVPVHIASGAGTSVVELTERLHALTGARVDWTYGPPVPGEVHRIVLGIARAERLLGWRPRVAMEEGLRRTVEWFEAHPVASA